MADPETALEVSASCSFARRPTSSNSITTERWDVIDKETMQSHLLHDQLKAVDCV